LLIPRSVVPIFLGEFRGARCSYRPGATRKGEQ